MQYTLNEDELKLIYEWAYVKEHETDFSEQEKALALKIKKVVSKSFEERDDRERIDEFLEEISLINENIRYGWESPKGSKDFFYLISCKGKKTEFSTKTPYIEAVAKIMEIAH